MATNHKFRVGDKVTCEFDADALDEGNPELDKYNGTGVVVTIKQISQSAAYPYVMEEFEMNCKEKELILFSRVKPVVVICDEAE